MHAARFLPVANRVFQSLLFTKCSQDRIMLSEIAQQVSPSLTVKSGPFVGMVYPTLAAAGSMLCPKILGTYESEIAGIFRPDYLNQFDVIIDVGCAEGYYAIGCAITTTRPRILAYDTSPDARKLCQAMDTSNGVSERVEIQGSCSCKDLSFLTERRAFVISDCEGYEKDLFLKECVSFLEYSDVIIEVHSQYGVDIMAIEKMFSQTHLTEVIYSKTDFEKAHEYDVPDLKHAGIATVVEALAECRPLRMPWLHARSKKISGQKCIGSDSARPFSPQSESS